MPEYDKNENDILQALQNQLHSLENRIRRIEGLLITNDYQDTRRNAPGLDEDTKIQSDERDSAIESNVVEYGLAWLSSIVYLFGVIFFMAYIRNSGHSLWASYIGYAAVICIFLLSFFLRKSFPHLVFVLTISGLLLLYYVTLRLYYFDIQPVIPSANIVLILILAVLSGQVYYSVKRKSEFFGFIIIALALITAIIVDTAPMTLVLIFLSSIGGLFYFSKLGWWRVLFICILLTYFTHMIWFLNNPLMGHPMQSVSSPQHSLIFLFFYAVTFSVSILLPRKKAVSDTIYGMMAFTNALNFILLVSLEALTFYKNNYEWIFVIISLLCLVFSIFLKSKTDKLFTPAFYACFGFLTLSISIYGFAGFPNTYLLLAIQSLLVVSWALWYRSKIIVVVNTFLYLSILGIYLTYSPSIDSINFTFAIIALSTARILNWQKERLTLKTDLLRILYLIAGFTMVLFGLSKAFPEQFITLSWMIAAVIFLLLSIILKNSRYRWMSIITVIFTGLHLLIVDMASMEIGYKVIAFMFFAVTTLGISLYYTKRIKKKSNAKNTPNIH